MKATLTKLIICPTCGKKLKTTVINKIDSEIIEGLIRCSDGHISPIIEGVPRLCLKSVIDKNVNSFNFIWNKYSISTNNDVNTFLERTGMNKKYFKHKLVLDAGCGEGRFTNVMASLGSEVVAVDLSFGVERIFSKKNTHIIQGDINSKIFKPNTFDFILCYGVIHHTANPYKTLKNLSRLLKKKGVISFWVYPKGNFVQESLNNIIRTITTKIPEKILFQLSKIISPLVPLIWNTLRNGDYEKIIGKRNKTQIVMDWLSPKYQSHHTREEVLNWMKSLHMEVINDSPYHLGFTAQLKE